MAKEVFELGANSEVQILSDKAYRKTLENSYEAHGNVIIKLKGDTIYGEKASINLKEQRAQVLGNVRYVGSEYTLYASSLVYKLDEKTLEGTNAKLVSPTFTIVGKKLSRLSNGHFFSEDAEYSTCKDCPESWSMLGNEVQVIPDQYIYIKHAFVKINGVIIVYFPYIAFPIKKERETGLLFPRFSFDTDKGFYFKQPFFYAISEDQDATIAPTFFGDRGQGMEWEYRKAINSKSDLSFFGIDVFDQIWQPGKTDQSKNESREFRQFYSFDFSYQPNNKFSLWTNIEYLSDLDILGDYESYLYERLVSNEKGFELNSQYRFSFVSLGLDASFMRNNFFENAKGFDHDYVQTLPRISIDQSQVNLIYDKLIFKTIDFGQKLVYTKFRPNHDSGSSFERNVDRVDYTPYLDIKYNFSDKIRASQYLELDYQYYKLNSLDDSNEAKKYGPRLNTSIEMDVYKEFGKPYVIEHKVTQVETVNDDTLISNIPIIDAKERIVNEVVSSYIHNINYSLNHSMYNKQKFSGNTGFLDNLESDVSGGRFDNRDIIRGTNNTLLEEATRKDIPENNSLELKMRNSLYRKSPSSKYDPYRNFSSVTSNFDLKRIAWFDISQGVLLNTEEEAEFNEKLTRLFIATGFSLGDFKFGISEYYFHSTSENITTFSFNHKMERLSYNLSYYYDSFSEERRDFVYKISFKLSDLLDLYFSQEYDLYLNRFYTSTFRGTYNPNNNCWKFALQYKERDIISDGKKVSEQVFSFDFLLNYNNKAFTPAFNFEI